VTPSGDEIRDLKDEKWGAWDAIAKIQVFGPRFADAQTPGWPSDGRSISEPR
jgi:hypothetical protein